MKQKKKVLPAAASAAHTQLMRVDDAEPDVNEALMPDSTCHGRAGSEQKFVLQACDMFGNNRSGAADVVAAVLTKVDLFVPADVEGSTNGMHCTHALHARIACTHCTHALHACIARTHCTHALHARMHASMDTRMHARMHARTVGLSTNGLYGIKILTTVAGHYRMHVSQIH